MKTNKEVNIYSKPKKNKFLELGFSANLWSYKSYPHSNNIKTHVDYFNIFFIKFCFNTYT